jgi:predicted outer membrane repeat protein
MFRIAHCRRIVAVALAALTGTVASAQHFNIEINANADSTGMPVFFFEGAAGESGGWNNINPSASTFTLRNTDSVMTDVTLTVAGQGSIVSGPTPGMSGALANVMADYHAVNVGLIKYTLSNLDFGRYAVYVYAGHPSDTNARSAVRMIGDQWTDTQVIGGPKNGSTVDPGDLYSVHVIDLVFSDEIEIYVEPFTGTATCAAIQIVKLPDNARLRMYVDDTATGDGHGAYWFDAMTDLQEALRTASLAGGSKTEVWVARGNYRPTSGTDRSATFRVPSGLALYGGFFGDEATLAERTNPAFNITNLTGAIGGSSQDDNSYTVVTVENANSNTIIDGFSISRGNNSALGVDSNGGGVRIINSSPTFRNTKFLSNFAMVDGAGVYVKSGFPRFVDCLFYNNATSLGAGGGLGVAEAGNATVYNSQFVKNTAASHGGAAQIYGGARFANTVFDGNFAPSNGGAINITATTDVREFSQCTFAGNRAGGAGGAIHLDTSAPTNVFNSIMHQNSDNSGRSSVKGDILNLTVSNSIAENLPSGVNGVNNSSEDPRFIDADGANNTFGDFDNNFRLERGSPAIDRGSNILAPSDAFDFDNDQTTGEIVPFDMDRNSRVVLTPYALQNSGAPTVDMGAFEHQATCAGDLNGDRVVDFADLNILLSNYGTGSAASDTNGDGQVNFADLNLVLVEFGSACPQ